MRGLTLNPKPLLPKKAVMLIYANASIRPIALFVMAAINNFIKGRLAKKDLASKFRWLMSVTFQLLAQPSKSPLLN
jgi:hypothetical protein